jgi:hypothetical protein
MNTWPTNFFLTEPALSKPYIIWINQTDLAGRREMKDKNNMNKEKVKNT